MVSAAAKLCSGGRKLLSEACERNRSAELHYQEGDTFRTGRARLLAIDQQEVWIDTPRFEGDDVRLAACTPLTVYFMHGGEHRAFRTEVSRRHALFQLNQTKQIDAMTLVLPSEIRTEQRRYNFRVSLARYDLPVDLHEACSAEPCAAPLGAIRFSGRIVNISGGGCAVLTPTSKTPGLMVWDTLVLHFELPGHQQRVVLPAELRNIRSVGEGTQRVCGFRFVQTDTAQIRPAALAVERFVRAAEQRQTRGGRSGP